MNLDPGINPDHMKIPSQKDLLQLPLSTTPLQFDSLYQRLRHSDRGSDPFLRRFANRVHANYPHLPNLRLLAQHAYTDLEKSTRPESSQEEKDRALGIFAEMIQAEIDHACEYRANLLLSQCYHAFHPPQLDPSNPVTNWLHQIAHEFRKQIIDQILVQEQRLTRSLDNVHYQAAYRTELSKEFGTTRPLDPDYIEAQPITLQSLRERFYAQYTKERLSAYFAYKLCQQEVSFGKNGTPPWEEAMKPFLTANRIALDDALGDGFDDPADRFKPGVLEPLLRAARIFR